MTKSAEIFSRPSRREWRSTNAIAYPCQDVRFTVLSLNIKPIRNTLAYVGAPQLLRLRIENIAVFIDKWMIAGSQHARCIVWARRLDQTGRNQQMKAIRANIRHYKKSLLSG
jgi:hypothetical protein